MKIRKIISNIISLTILNPTFWIILLVGACIVVSIIKFPETQEKRREKYIEENFDYLYDYFKEVFEESDYFYTEEEYDRHYEEGYEEGYENGYEEAINPQPKKHTVTITKIS